MTDAVPLLQGKNLHKRFGAIEALGGVDVELNNGEILAVLGPSGCGKSTLLYVIAGLETPDSGEVLWEGRSLANVPPHKRNFGLMFQDYALFPHLDVAANIAFGPQLAGWPSEQIHQRVSETLTLVGLMGYDHRSVDLLSGGEQQRVALARALAPRPALLMLDEPLGALDRDLRTRLLAELQTILRSLGQTAIYVTHDQQEAFEIADRVIVMRAGRVEQAGTPQEIYRRPANRFVAGFLGMENLLAATLEANAYGRWLVCSAGRFPLFENSPTGPQPWILIRPDAAQIPPQHDAVHVTGRLEGIAFRGTHQRISIYVSGGSLTFEVPGSSGLPKIGEQLTIGIDPRKGVEVFWE